MGALMPSVPSMISTNNESIPQPTQEFTRSGRRQPPHASDNLNLNQLTPKEEKIVSTWCQKSHAVDYQIHVVVVEWDIDKSAAVARADRHAASQVRDSVEEKTRIRIHHAQ
jgi:hypothetical protein